MVEVENQGVDRSESLGDSYVSWANNVDHAFDATLSWLG
jgi:hypothetical protein